MSGDVNVRSIQALEDLRAALARFAGEARQTMQAADLEVRRAREFLANRERHWAGEITRRQAEVERAERAYAACRQPVRDPETGAVYQAPCTQEGAAMHAAQARLAEAQAELKNVQAWTQRVEQAAGEYQRQASRLSAHVGAEIPRAAALISRKMDSLHAYASGGVGGAVGAALAAGLGALAAAPSGGSSSSGPPSARGMGPGQDIHDVPLAAVDLDGAGVSGPADFKKLAYERMVDGVRKLRDVVRPAVLRGATGDDFYRMDQELGLSDAEGYKQVYDVFYGTGDPVAVGRVGDRYTVLSGRHRIFAARALGLDSIPARIVGGGG